MINGMSDQQGSPLSNLPLDQRRRIAGLVQELAFYVADRDKYQHKSENLVQQVQKMKQEWKKQETKIKLQRDSYKNHVKTLFKQYEQVLEEQRGMQRQLEQYQNLLKQYQQNLEEKEQQLIALTNKPSSELVDQSVNVEEHSSCTLHTSSSVSTYHQGVCGSTDANLSRKSLFHPLNQSLSLASNGGSTLTKPQTNLHSNCPNRTPILNTSQSADYVKNTFSGQKPRNKFTKNHRSAMSELEPTLRWSTSQNRYLATSEHCTRQKNPDVQTAFGIRGVLSEKNMRTKKSFVPKTSTPSKSPMASNPTNNLAKTCNNINKALNKQISNVCEREKRLKILQENHKKLLETMSGDDVCDELPLNSGYGAALQPVTSESSMSGTLAGSGEEEEVLASLQTKVSCDERAVVDEARNFRPRRKRDELSGEWTIRRGSVSHAAGRQPHTVVPPLDLNTLKSYSQDSHGSSPQQTFSSLQTAHTNYS